MTINGKYEAVSSDNMDNYLQAVGMSPEARKLVSSGKPVVEVTENGNSYSFTAVTPARSVTIKFEDGKPFDEETLDGRKAKSTVTRSGNTFTHVQKFDNQTVTRVSTFEGDTLTVTFQVGDVKASVVHKRV